MTSEQLEWLISRYQTKVFSLAFHLTNGDEDKAYDIATSGLAQALRQTEGSQTQDALMPEAVQSILEECRKLSLKPSAGASPVANSGTAENALKVVRLALEGLAFDQKAFILLRDQLNLSYGQIAAVFGFSESEAQRRTLEARSVLRRKVEYALR